MNRITLFIGLLLSSISHAYDGSVLGEFAKTLSAGQWSQCTTCTVPNTVNGAGDDQDFGSKILNNPVRNALHWGGTVHNDTVVHWYTYERDTNSWDKNVTIPSIPGPDIFVHGYENTSIDPITQRLYWKWYTNKNMRHFQVGTDSSWSAEISVDSCSNWPNPVDAGAIARFPDRDEVVMNWGAYGTVAVSGFPSNPSSTDLVCAGSATGLHAFARYSVAGKMVFFGGGNGTTAMWTYDENGTVAQRATMPEAAGSNLNMARVAASPVDGDLYMFDTSGDIRRWAVSNNSWSDTGNNHTLHTAHSGRGMVGTVPEYGAIVALRSTNSSGANEFWVYKVGEPTDPNYTDFQNRCADPSVSVCIGFENQSDYDDYIFLDGFENNVTLDTNKAQSGNQSLRFRQPTLSDAAVGGSWRINFNGCSFNGGAAAWDACTTAAGGLVEHGSGDALHWQYAYQLGPEHDTVRPLPYNSGIKLSLTGYGDQVGQALEGGSCSANELVVQDTLMTGFYQFYHACGNYAPMDTTCAAEGNPPGCNAPDDIIKTQNKAYQLNHPTGEDRCFYHGDGGPPSPTFPKDVSSYGPCAALQVDNWGTIQVRVDIGTDIRAGDWYGGGFASAFCGSRIRIWAQDNWGEASRLVSDFSDMCLRRDTVESGWGKIWLLPYITGKDASQDTGPLDYFYDDLIVSGDCINDPGTGAPPVGCAAAPPPVMTCPRNFTAADDAATIKTDLEDTSCNTYTFEDGVDLSGLGVIQVSRSNPSGPYVTIRPSGAGTMPILPPLDWVGSYTDIQNVAFARTSATCLEVTGNSWIAKGVEFRCGDEGLKITGDNSEIESNLFTDSVTGARRHALTIAGQSNEAHFNTLNATRGIDILVSGNGHLIHHNTIDKRSLQTNCSGTPTAGGDCIDGGNAIRFGDSTSVSVYSNAILGSRPADPTLSQGTEADAAIQIDGAVSFSSVLNNIIGGCEAASAGLHPTCPGMTGTAIAVSDNASVRTGLAINYNLIHQADLSTQVPAIILRNATLSEILSNTIRGDESASGASWLNAGTGDNQYRGHLLVAAGTLTAPSAASVSPTWDGTVYINPVSVPTGLGETLSFGPYDLTTDGVGNALGPCAFTASLASGPTTFYQPNVRPLTNALWTRTADQSAPIDATYGLGVDIAEPPGGPEDLCTTSL